MPPHLGRKRARTADRDRVVEAITQAYVDGQINDAAREERITRALTSTTLDGLRPLVADLQVPSHLQLPEAVHPKPAPPQRRTTTPATGRPKSWRESWERLRQAPLRERVLLAVVGSTLVGLTGYAFVMAAIGTDAPTHPDMTSVAGIEQMIDAVEQEFGTTEVLEVEAHDTWAHVYVPVDESARYRIYTYGWDDGQPAFSDAGQGGTTAEADPDFVDLAALDVEQLVENIDEAPADLGMEGELEIVVNITDELMSTDFGVGEAFAMGEEDAPAHVEIGLRNEFNEKASITTNLAGTEVLAEHPYEPPS